MQLPTSPSVQSPVPDIENQLSPNETIIYRPAYLQEAETRPVLFNDCRFEQIARTALFHGTATSVGAYALGHNMLEPALKGLKLGVALGIYDVLSTDIDQQAELIPYSLVNRGTFSVPVPVLEQNTFSFNYVANVSRIIDGQTGEFTPYSFMHRGIYLDFPKSFLLSSLISTLLMYRLDGENKHATGAYILGYLLICLAISKDRLSAEWCRRRINDPINITNHTMRDAREVHPHPHTD